MELRYHPPTPQQKNAVTIAINGFGQTTITRQKSILPFIIRLGGVPWM